LTGWKIAAREVAIERVCTADGGASLADPAGYAAATWDRSDPSYRRPLLAREG
jgi:hypothetical protein